MLSKESAGIYVRDRSCRLLCSLRLKAREQYWHLYFLSGARRVFREAGVEDAAAGAGACAAETFAPGILWTWCDVFCRVAVVVVQQLGRLQAGKTNSSNQRLGVLVDSDGWQRRLALGRFDLIPYRTIVEIVPTLPSSLARAPVGFKVCRLDCEGRCCSFGSVCGSWNRPFRGDWG